MKCTECDKEKPPKDYYDSYPSKCKECVKASARRRRLENIDAVRAYDRRRARLPHRKNRAIEITRRARARDVRYAKAHAKVARAIIRGTLKRLPCEMCGRKDHIHAHHDDYDKPLDVMWLCPVCHKVRHKELDAMAPKEAK